jgi:hypothetical protein
MFTVKVPSFVVEQSRMFVQECDLGKRGDGSDGTVDQQLVGVIAQNMALLAIGEPFLRPSKTHDGGVDFVVFGHRIDIKAMGRSVDVALNYVNNLVASQMRLNADAFLFTSYNSKSGDLTVCGWIPKALFKQRAAFFEKGQTRTRTDGTSFCLKADMYELANSAICHKATGWPELWAEMSVWAAARRLLSVQQAPEPMPIINGEYQW